MAPGAPGWRCPCGSARAARPRRSRGGGRVGAAPPSQPQLPCRAPRPRRPSTAARAIGCRAAATARLPPRPRAPPASRRRLAAGAVLPALPHREWAHQQVSSARAHTHSSTAPLQTTRARPARSAIAGPPRILSWAPCEGCFCGFRLSGAGVRVRRGGGGRTPGLTAPSSVIGRPSSRSSKAAPPRPSPPPDIALDIAPACCARATLLRRQSDSHTATAGALHSHRHFSRSSSGQPRASPLE
jgi:hypothetical protein